LIDQAEDIYWLEKAEIVSAVNNVESGEPLGNLSERIHERKLEREYLKSITPPPVLPPKERIMGIKTDLYIATAESAQTGDRLKGVAASGGKITTSACVIREPQDFNKMESGAVLVATATTRPGLRCLPWLPQWLPTSAAAFSRLHRCAGVRHPRSDGHWSSH